MAVHVVIAYIPVLVIIAIISAVVLYMKTKSLAKVGSTFQIIMALGVFGLTTQLVDGTIIGISVLLGLGMLVSGIRGLK